MAFAWLKSRLSIFSDREERPSRNDLKPALRRMILNAKEAADENEAKAIIKLLHEAAEQLVKDTDKGNVPKRAQPAAASNQDLVQKLQAAWTIKYKDPSSNTHRLYNHLVSCYKQWTRRIGNFYAPYFAVFQSSGHGKSRLVHELCTSRSIPHLYICFRPAASTGFPPRTRHLATYLTEKPSPQKWDAVFSAVLDLFREVTKTETVGSTLTPFEKWENYKTSIDLEAKICGKAGELLLREANSYCVYEAQATDLKSLPFLFVLDEARELVETTDDSGRSSFRMFRKSLSNCKAGVFAILMDTLASIANFPPTVENDPSLRGAAPKNLFPPFHLVVNVDVFAQSPATLTAAEITQQLEPRNLVTKGRILWTSTILGAARTGQVSASTTNEQLLAATKLSDWIAIVELAAMKLVGGQSEWSVDTLSRVASVSVLSARAQVSIVPTSASSSVSVGSHLATCMNISKNRDAVFSMYPSEPSVAAGAFHVVWAHGAGSWRSMANYAKLLSHLQTSLMQGVVDAGQCGELVARLLLNIAWDLSVGCVEEFYSMISLKGFLNNLIGSDRLVEAKEILADQTIFDARMCFTHFVPISYIPNEQDLVKLMSRGAAAICQRNQVGVDLMIPLLLKDDVISVFLISVKNQKAQFDSSWPSSAGARVSLQTVCPELLNVPPYFTLLMQLGARESMVFAGQHEQHSALAVFGLHTFCPSIGDATHPVYRSLQAILNARQGIEGIFFPKTSAEVVPNLVPLLWTAAAPPRRYDDTATDHTMTIDDTIYRVSSASSTHTSNDTEVAKFCLVDAVSRTSWTLDGWSTTTTEDVTALFQQQGLAATILRPIGDKNQMKRVLQPVELDLCLCKIGKPRKKVVFLTINTDDIGLVRTHPARAEEKGVLELQRPDKSLKALPKFVQDYLTNFLKAQQKRRNKRKRGRETTGYQFEIEEPDSKRKKKRNLKNKTETSADQGP